MKARVKKSIKKIVPLLNCLEELSVENRIELLPFLQDEVFDFISECVHNTLYNSNFGSDVRNCLKKHLKHDASGLRYIANQKKPLKLRKKKIQQYGGGILFMLSTLLPVLLNLIKK